MRSSWRYKFFGVALAVAIVALVWSSFRMRADVRGPVVKTGFVHPVLTIVRGRVGGTVGEVHVKSGDHLEAGQLLLRLEAKELEDRLKGLRKAAQAAESGLRGANAMAQLPNQVRQLMYDLHPETGRADREYAEALTSFDKAQGAAREASGVRLRKAEVERMRVRRDLGQLFAREANPENARAYHAEIARAIQGVEKLIEETVTRAPDEALVDIMDIHAGDKIQPGQPVAVLISTKNYLVDVGVTAGEWKRLHPGLALKGRLEGSGAAIEGWIESTFLRRIPVIARDNLRVAEGPVVRVRIVSAEPLRGGATVAFELP